jgi:dienelactone hydrolase
MMAHRKRGIAIAILVVVAAGWWLAPLLGAVAFVLDIGGVETRWRLLLPGRHQSFASDLRTVPTRHGPVAVRVYRPERSGHTVIVFPGVHGGGVDEPRLARFCSRLASTGATVVCAPLPELREFLITPHSTDQIEDVTKWAADEVRVDRTTGVALVGVSFAGGLALVAAGRPALIDRVALVVSIGGHGDLPRALTYLATGRLPDGSVRPPHDYGLAVLAYNAVDHLAPADQVPRLEHGIRTFLEASLDDSPGQPIGARLLADARAEAQALPEPAHGILVAVTDRQHNVLGNRLLPLIPTVAGDAALSPERSPAPRAAVFLLHGLEDNVIPSTEAPLVDAYLRAQHNTSVRTLLTPLLSHANLRTSTSLGDAWRLVRFWQSVLAALA